MNIFQRLKWIKKKFSWDYKYRKGKWDYMGNEKLRYETIVNYINELKIEKPTILDLGCGYGALLDVLISSKLQLLFRHRFIFKCH